MDPPENRNYLDMWQTKSQSTPLPTNLRPAKPARSSTPRVEPGTHKVNDHEAKKNAVTLLYAVAECLKQSDTQLHKDFLSHIKKDMEDVVGDFGFQKETIQSAGEKLGASIIKEIHQEQELIDLDTQVRALTTKLDAMKKDHQARRGGRFDIEGTGDGNSSLDPRTTRGGNAKKRDRDVSDLEEKIVLMQAICKRMKKD